MRTSVAISLLLLSGISCTTVAAEFSAVSKTPQQTASPRQKGQLGGVVASYVKARNGDYVTRYKGDEVAFNTPASAGGLHIKVSKLKAGDVNCVPDDGSRPCAASPVVPAHLI